MAKETKAHKAARLEDEAEDRREEAREDAQEAAAAKKVEESTPAPEAPAPQAPKRGAFVIDGRTEVRNYIDGPDGKPIFL